MAKPGFSLLCLFCVTVFLGVLMHVRFCLPDCIPEGPFFSAEFVCVSVCDRHFYPSLLTDFDETWSQGPYCDLVWPRP